MTSGGLIYITGDYICQIFLEGNKHQKDASWYKPNFQRSLKMLMVGTLISGPIAKFVYWQLNPYYLRNIIPKLVPF